MVVAVHNNTGFLQNGNQFRVTANMLTQAMGDLQDAARGSTRVPTEAGDRQTITAREMKFL